MENKQEQTKVWDLFVRLFHWSIVGLVALSYFSGEFEWEVHSYSGYAIFTLVCLRTIWGLVGSQYARFKNFVFSPSNVLTYLKSIASGNPKRFLGHNPAGGMMILALLTVLAVTTLSGMKLYAIEEGEGPFASNMEVSVLSSAHADGESYSQYSDEHHEDEEAEEFWEDIHETSINLLMILILLHVLGVVVASKQHKENLVRSMINGKKKPLD